MLRHGVAKNDQFVSHTMEGAQSGSVQQWRAGAGDRSEEEEEAAAAKSE
jgi:hypothetical protein